MRAYLLAGVKKVFPRLGLRRPDVLLASYPKSGNTWIRFIWANIGSLEDLDGREIDFHTLNTEMDAEYDRHSYGATDFDSLPRLVKTHSVYSERAFGANRSIYLHRHPGDVLVSYHHFLAARKDSPIGDMDFATFIRHEKYGLPAWCRHVRSWSARADVVVTYRELKEDAAKTTRYALDQLGIEGIADRIIAEAVERSSFDALRSLEEERGRPRTDDFASGYRFVRKGRVGEWQEVFSPRDREYMRSTLAEEGLASLAT